MYCPLFEDEPRWNCTRRQPRIPIMAHPKRLMQRTARMSGGEVVGFRLFRLESELLEVGVDVGEADANVEDIPGFNQRLGA